FFRRFKVFRAKSKHRKQGSEFLGRKPPSAIAWDAASRFSFVLNLVFSARSDRNRQQSFRYPVPPTRRSRRIVRRYRKSAAGQPCSESGWLLTSASPRRQTRSRPC